MKRRAYLVFCSTRGVVVERTSSFSDDADYARIRAMLERHFPGRVVASPFDAFPTGGEVVAVWTSTEADGRRDASSFHEWAVGPQP